MCHVKAVNSPINSPSSGGTDDDSHSQDDVNQVSECTDQDGQESESQDNQGKDSESQDNLGQESESQNNQDTAKVQDLNTQENESTRIHETDSQDNPFPGSKSVSSACEDSESPECTTLVEESVTESESPACESQVQQAEQLSTEDSDAQSQNCHNMQESEVLDRTHPEDSSLCSSLALDNISLADSISLPDNMSGSQITGDVVSKEMGR